MKPTIRQNADGIELFDGDNLNFRAWPLTHLEALRLQEAIVEHYRKRGWLTAVHIKYQWEQPEGTK